MPTQLSEMISGWDLLFFHHNSNRQSLSGLLTHVEICIEITIRTMLLFFFESDTRWTTRRQQFSFPQSASYLKPGTSRRPNVGVANVMRAVTGTVEFYGLFIYNSKSALSKGIFFF